MMKFASIVIFSLCLMGPAITHAQTKTDPASSETYNSKDFSLQYPADWEADEEFGLILHIPIPGESDPNPEGIVISLEDLSAMITFQESGEETALAFAQHEVSEMIGEDQDIFDAGLALGFEIGGRDAALADVNGMMPMRFVVMTTAEDSKVVVFLVGASQQQFVEVMPQLTDVLNSVRLPEDDHPIEATTVNYLLPQTHIRKGNWTFDYPEDWLAEDQKSYTLLTIPGVDTTLGISVLHHEEADDLDGWADSVLDNLLNSVPTGEHATVHLTVNERPALRLDFQVPEENFGFTELFVNADDNLLVNITAIGAPRDIAILNPLIEQIASTAKAV